MTPFSENLRGAIDGPLSSINVGSVTAPPPRPSNPQPRLKKLPFPLDMAPSRGLTALSRTTYSTNSFRANCFNTPRYRYTHARLSSSLPTLASDATRKTQIYISRTPNPYLNLSIEHYLLQHSPADSTILFLYTNRPCVVIGRNQNPWIEVDLRLLKRGLLGNDGDTNDGGSGGGRKAGKVGEGIDLVRRRSGGGTVFHDGGNANYSVICPPAAFDRDKHAHMVVRALHSLGVPRAKVNERHDIVIDVRPDAPSGEEEEDINETTLPLLAPKPRKVSGSAYKLTRLRALHHGTCLLSSPNIGGIGRYLKAPAKPFIRARGVDSVSSPIANVGVSTRSFEEAVVREFGRMYGPVEPVEVGGEEALVPEIAKGLAELESEDWTYLQTPQFTFSSHATDNDPRERPELPDYVPVDASVQFTARNGMITEADIVDGEIGGGTAVGQTLVGRKVHEIRDWESVLSRGGGVGRWLNGLFGA